MFENPSLKDFESIVLPVAVRTVADCLREAHEIHVSQPFFKLWGDRRFEQLLDHYDQAAKALCDFVADTAIQFESRGTVDSKELIANAALFMHEGLQRMYEDRAMRMAFLAETLDQKRRAKVRLDTIVELYATSMRKIEIGIASNGGSQMTNNVIKANAIHGTVIQGSHGVQVNNQGFDLRQLSLLLPLIERAAAEAPHSDIRDEVAHQLAKIRNELDSRSPQPTVLKGLLSTLRSIVEKTIAGALGGELQTAIAFLLNSMGC